MLAGATSGSLKDETNVSSLDESIDLVSSLDESIDIVSSLDESIKQFHPWMKVSNSFIRE